MQFAQRGISSLGAAHGDVVALAHAAFGIARLGAGEADGSHVGLATGVGAAGPVDLQLLGQFQFAVELLSGGQGLILGIGEREAAVGVAGAAHGAGGQVAGLEAEPLQQRLGPQRLKLSGGDAAENHVLVFGEADIAVAVALGQAGQILKVFGLEATHRHVQTGVMQSLLFLRVNAVVAARRFVEHRARIRGEGPEALLHHGPEGFDAHLIEVETEAPLRTLVAFAVIAPDLDHRTGDGADLIRTHPGVERDRIGIHLRGEDAADPHAEAELAIALHRMEDDVVVEQEVVASSSHSGVPLARQIGEFRVATAVVGEVVLQLHRVGPGIHDLLGVDAGDRIAGHVPGVIECRLNRGEPHLLQAFQDVGEVLKQHAAQLDVLPGGDIGAAVAAVAGHDAAHHAQLLGADHAVGNS